MGIMSNGTETGGSRQTNVSQTTGNEFLDDLNDAFLLNMYKDQMLMIELPAIIYTAIMIVLGLPGNLIVFFVYFFKWRKSTSRIFILFLAFLDTLNCSTTLPMEIYLLIKSLKLDQPLLCKLSRYCTYVMNCSSALILVGIAADRFKRICRPYERPFSEKQSKYICIGAILFSMAITWPSLVLYGTREVKLGNVTGYICLLENQFDGTPFPMMYFCLLTTTTALTFSMLIVLYYFIGLQIYRHSRFKLKHCSHVQKIVNEPLVINGDKNGKPAETNFSKPKNECFVQYEMNSKEIKDISNENKYTDQNDAIIDSQSNDKTNCRYREVPQDENIDGKQLKKKTELGETKQSDAFSVIQIKSTSIASHKASSLESKRASVPQSQNHIKNDQKKPGARYLMVRGESMIEEAIRSNCMKCVNINIGRSTLMLFLITIAYVISFLPFYCLVIIRQTDTNFVKTLSKTGLAVYHLFLRSYLLSSAVNPFIYSFCNSQFRSYCKESFLSMFCKR